MVIKSDTYTLQQFVDKRYIFNVPIYQRLYVWRAEQIKTLLEDLEQAFYEKRDSYYLGAIMLRFNNNSVDYDLIDGQQRFSTIWILMYLLENKKFTYIDTETGQSPRLRFSARDFADQYFRSPELIISESELEQLHPFVECMNIIKNFFKEQTPEIQKRYKNGFPKADFCNYIYHKVKFLVTILPPETDVNKLFEVLNNRGVQLQQHEILKSKLLKYIPIEERTKYAILWDACSIMDNYIEKSFKDIAGLPWKDIAGEITDKNDLEIDKDQERTGISDDINEILNKIDCNSPRKETFSLIKILELGEREAICQKNKVDESDQNTDYDEGEIRSIISFPMFLLHVFRIFLYENKYITDKKDIPPVKEKELISIFSEFRSILNRESVVDFFRILWKIRVRFDNYIVKWVKNADGKEEDLIVKKLYYNKKSYSFQRQPLLNINSDGGFALLQAMLYHSQQLTTQYWLTPLLGKLLRNNDERILYHYLRVLDNVMFCSGNEEELSLRSYALLDENNFTSLSGQLIEYVNQQLKAHLGVGYASYWFYKTEFVLWFLYDQNASREDFKKAVRLEEWRNFKMTAKNSVEHISAQKERGEEINRFWEDEDELLPEEKKQRKDDFGNLVLLTSSINSEYSNKTYKEKQFIFGQKKRLDSLKSSLIFQNDIWNWSICQEHRNLIIALFKEYLISNSVL